MNKKYIPLIASAITLVVVGISSYYFIIYRPGEDITTAEKAITVISSKIKVTDPAALSKLGTDYLIAWARALRSGRDTFIFNGKTYNSLTGTSL